MTSQSDIPKKDHLLDVDALGNLHVTYNPRTPTSEEQPLGYYDTLGSYHAYKDTVHWYRERKEKSHDRN